MGQAGTGAVPEQEILLDTLDTSSAEMVETLPAADGPMLSLPVGSEGGDLDRRTFFVQAPTWIRTEMIATLTRAEVPSHTIDDPSCLKKLCESFPGSLLVINGDFSMPDRFDWKLQLQLYAEVFRRMHITILFMDRGLTAQRQQEMRIESVPMAFVELNQSFKTVQNLIFAIAVKVCHKGRRRFIRVDCEGIAGQPAFNVKLAGTTVRGKVRDLSSTGMACYPDESIINSFFQGQDLHGIQLLLRGSPVLVSGIVYGVRQSEGKHVTVVLFRWKDDTRGRDRIHGYIAQRLQEDLRTKFGL